MKKKRFAMLAVMLLTTVSCMLMTGCGSGKARTESQMKRVAEKLLEEKYDEEFEIHYAWPRDSSLFYATCSPKDDMDIVFEMQAYNDGRGLYMDKYLQGAVAKLVEAEIEPKIQEIFEDAYLEVAFTWITETKDYYEGVTIEEYCQLYEDIGCYLQIFANKESIEYNAQQVQEEFEHISELCTFEIVQNSGCRIYFVDNETLNKCKSYFHKKSGQDGEFLDIVNDVPYFGFGFNEGMINKSLEEYIEVRKEMNNNE